LIYGPPKIVLLAINLHKYFVNLESISIISVAEIKPVVKPDGIADDIWRESMTFISIHLSISEV